MLDFRELINFDWLIKIIFLDIDGVLNHQEFYSRRDLKEHPHPYNNIDPISVGHLNTLVEMTGAKFVISSTWRSGRTIAELQEILDYHGFKGEVIGKTVSLRASGLNRGAEILKWIEDNSYYSREENRDPKFTKYPETNIIPLKYHEYKNYVILDDDSDMLLWQKDNFVQTDMWTGFTMGHVYKCKKILNSPYRLDDRFRKN